MLSCKANNELMYLVQEFKKSKNIALAKQSVNVSKQALEILNLISIYRKSKSKDVAESILNYYDSIDNRKEIFGKHFRKIQAFVCRLRKKFSVNSNTDNEVKRRIISLIQEFKITRSLDTARKICEVYDSITESKSKILGRDYGRIKLYVWNLKKKFLNIPEQIEEAEKTEKEK